VFMSDVGQLVASDSEVEEQTGAGYHGVNLWRFQTNGNVTATGTTFPTFSAEPTGLGYRLADRALLVSDDNQDRITFVLPGPDAIHGTADDTRTSFSTRPLSDDPEDVAYDSASGDVFILDGENKEVYRVARGPNGVFGDGDDVWSNFDVEQYGARDPEGIEYDAVNDALLVVDQRSHAAYELTKAGALLGTIDIRPTGSLMAAGIALAPSSIHPNRTNLWIVDRGVDNGPDPNENDGKVYELSVDTAGNTPPVVDSVAIDQTAPLTNDTLTATVTGHDDDDDPIEFRYQWRKNGTAIPDETASTLDLSVAGTGDKGDAISLRVVAFDGIVESSPLTSAQVTVANSPPLADAGADQTVNSGANFTLDATGSSDPDQDPLAYLWEQVSGPPAVIRDPGSAQTIVEGVTGPSTLEFRVTATDTSAAPGTDNVLVTVRAPK
jgi:K319-like protein